MKQSNTVGEFLESLVWIEGKPACPCCAFPIEACHKCKNRTAQEETEEQCSACFEEGNFPCRVCRKCAHV